VVSFINFVSENSIFLVFLFSFKKLSKILN